MANDLRGQSRTSGTGGAWKGAGAFGPANLTTQASADLRVTGGFTCAGRVDSVVNAMADLRVTGGFTCQGFINPPPSTITASYRAANITLSKSPRWTIVLSFDDANTEVIYLLSHPDGAAPGGATIISDCIRALSGRTQKIDPDRAVATIGNLSFEALDFAPDELVTDGDFASFTGWTLQGNWTEDAGNQRAAKSLSASDSILQTVAGLVPGRWYRIQWYQSATSGSLWVESFNTAFQNSAETPHTTTGTQTEILECTQAGTLELRGTLIGWIDNVSCVELSLTQKIYDELQSGNGLRGKRVQVWGGFEGDAWSAYSLRQTFQVKTLAGGDGRYIVDCDDISRETRKDIFEKWETRLRRSITATQDHIPVDHEAEDLEIFEHDSGYSSDPTTTCTYVKIQDEIIRVGSQTAPTGSNALYVHNTDGLSLHVQERGALGTDRVAHDITDGADISRQPKIEEFIYLEGPAVKLLYAILTGRLYGQSNAYGTDVLPERWHLGIDADCVRLSDLAHIGVDWWDTSNPSRGRRLRFAGIKKTDGKRFIEREILLWLGAFMPVYANGQLGLKRFVPILSNSGYVATLGENQVMSEGIRPVKHDMQAVINRISVDWNWSHLVDLYTKTNELIDLTSISKHGKSAFRNFKFRGVHTSAGTDTDLADHFATLRSRYAGPPLRMPLPCLPSTNTLDVGDPVRVNLPKLRDPNTGQGLDRVFEIQQANIDWLTGAVEFDLFGSSQAAGAISPPSDSSVVDGDFYGSFGLDLNNHLTITDGTISSTGNLPGGDYYYFGDLILGDGVTVTINDTVRLFVRGNFTVNGKFDGKGRGLSGGAGQSSLSGSAQQGSQGFVGNSRGASGLTVTKIWIQNRDGEEEQATRLIENRAEEPITRGLFSSPPDALTMRNTGAAIVGLPTNLVGTSGGGGGAAVSKRDSGLSGGEVYRQPGGGGGAGGAGLLIFSRGGGFGLSAEIDLSGNDGVIGNAHEAGFGTPANLRIYSGSGAGGQAGAVYWILDGNHAAPLLDTYLTANAGAHPEPSDLSEKNDDIPTVATSGDFYTTTGAVGGDVVTSGWVLYAPAYQPVEEEEDPIHKIATPTGLQLQRGAADASRINNRAQILAPVEATWTATTDPDFVAYELQMKRSSANAWRTVAEIRESTTAEHVEFMPEGERWVARLRIHSRRGAQGHSDYTSEVGFTMDFSAPGLFKEHHRLVAATANKFGGSVRIDRSGRFSLITARFHSPNGGASLYARRGAWEIVNSTITESGTATFGWHSAISQYASRFAISDRDYSSSTGRVFTYRYIDGAAFANDTTLTGDATGDQFGQSVDMNKDDGTVMVIGAPGYNNGTDDDGRIKICRRSGNVWTVEATFDGTASSGDRFGQCVAVSADGSTVAAIAPNEGSFATVHIYRWTGSAWTERDTVVTKTATDDVSTRDTLSLSDDGSWLAVGGSDTGEVLIFEEQTTDSWTEVEELEGSVGSFGVALAFGPGNSPTRIAIGENSGSYNGTTFIFERDDDGNWLEIQAVQQTEAESSASFGHSLDMNHDTLVAGAPDGSSVPQATFFEATNINA